MSRQLQVTAKSSVWRSKAGIAAQFLGALLVVSSVALALLSSHAGATSLTNTDVTVRIASSGAVANSPLSDGKVVDVSVAANSVLNRSSLQGAGYPSGAVPIKVLECADSGGQTANLPTKATDCEPATVISTADVQADGSLSLNGYVVYALPDTAALGSSSGTVCDGSHYCVLGIFADQNNFSKPHLFSAPFQVSPGASAGDPAGSGPSTQGTSTNSKTTSSSASTSVSVAPAALANTGSPTLWPWFLVSGAALLIGGTGMRLSRRRA